jgi:hypothetical protein
MPKLVTAAALCLLIAGCGGSSDTTAFKVDYQKASSPLDQAGADITRAIKSMSHHTASQIANQFTGFADRFDTGIIQLESLKPPASASGAFAAVTAAANRLVDDLRAISTSASRHDAIGTRTAIQALVTDAQAMNAGAGTVRQKLGLK